MKRALVIGAGGQIGSDLVPALHRKGCQVWMFDKFAAADTRAYSTLSAAFEQDPTWAERWHTGDAADSGTVRALIRDAAPDVVFHLAAMLSATGEADPRKCWEVNVESLRAVLDALASTGRRHMLIWPSSIAAFGPLPDLEDGYPAGPVPNDFTLRPTTMYGVTKVAGELLGDWYAAKGGVDFRSVRFPGLLNTARPGGGSSDYANELYLAAAEGRSSVQIFVRADTRIPFMHMNDAVRALTGLADADEKKLTRRTYNVGAFSPTAAEIADSIRRQGVTLDVRYVPDHRQAFVDSWPDDIDDQLARRDWGWKAQLGLDDTTRQLLADIRNL